MHVHRPSGDYCGRKWGLLRVAHNRQSAGLNELLKPSRGLLWDILLLRIY